MSCCKSSRIESLEKAQADKDNALSQEILACEFVSVVSPVDVDGDSLTLPGLPLDVLSHQSALRLRVPSSEIKVLKDYLATVPTSPDSEKVVIRKFAIDMTVKKLLCLREKTWLNDEVVNFYMELLQERSGPRPSSKSHKPIKTFFFSSFMYAKLVEKSEYDYSRVAKWSKKLNIRKCGRIILPINIQNTHWALVAIFMATEQIHFYDAKYENSSDSETILHNVRQWICDELINDELINDKLLNKHSDELLNKPKITAKITAYMKDWTLIGNFSSHRIMQDVLAASALSDYFKHYYFRGSEHHYPGRYVPLQRNNYDCGVFTCLIADFVSAGLPLLNAFKEADMPALRHKVGTDIIRGRLLP